MDPLQKLIHDGLRRSDVLNSSMHFVMSIDDCYRIIRHWLVSHVELCDYIPMKTHDPVVIKETKALIHALPETPSLTEALFLFREVMTNRLEWAFQVRPSQHSLGQIARKGLSHAAPNNMLLADDVDWLKANSRLGQFV